MKPDILLSALIICILIPVFIVTRFEITHEFRIVSGGPEIIISLLFSFVAMLYCIILRLFFSNLQYFISGNIFAFVLVYMIGTIYHVFNYVGSWWFPLIFVLCLPGPILMALFTSAIKIKYYNIENHKLNFMLGFFSFIFSFCLYYSFFILTI